MKPQIPVGMWLAGLSMFMALAGMMHWVDARSGGALTAIVVGLMGFTFFSAVVWAGFTEDE